MMKKYCGYCGTRTKTANTSHIVNGFINALNADTITVAGTEIDKNRVFLVVPDQRIWRIASGSSDNGHITLGGSVPALVNVASTANYLQLMENDNLQKYVSGLANQKNKAEEVLLLNEPNLDMKKNNVEIANRYYAYLTKMAEGNPGGRQQEYGSSKAFRELFFENAGADETSADGKVVPKKRPPNMSPQQYWESALKRFDLGKSLQTRKIIYLTPPPLGDTAGGSAQIMNILKDEYKAVSLMRKFRQESPPKKEAGERDYYDIALYVPSMVTRPQIGSRMLVKAEEITKLTLYDDEYTLGLIHSIG